MSIDQDLTRKEDINSQLLNLSMRGHTPSSTASSCYSSPMSKAEFYYDFDNMLVTYHPK